MFKLSLAIAMLVAGLTACSNSGASSSHSGKMVDNAKQATSNKQQATSNKQQATSNKQQATSKQIDHNSSQSSSHFNSHSKAQYGGVYLYTKGDRHNFFKPVSELAELTIGGKKFNLLLGQEYQKVVLDNSSFGIQRAQGKGGLYVFSTGKLTSQIPTSGKAIYLGKAVYGSSVELGHWVDGVSSFNVDFEHKTVNGEIQVANRTIKLLEAKINGNKFESQVITVGSGAADDELIRGNFFGENAAELGGIWKKEMLEIKDGKVKEFETVVFGATKQ